MTRFMLVIYTEDEIGTKLSFEIKICLIRKYPISYN